MGPRIPWFNYLVTPVLYVVGLALTAACAIKGHAWYPPEALTSYKCARCGKVCDATRD